MEARFLLPTALVAVAVSLGASYRTANFIIEAPTPQLAEKIGKSAEQYRRALAIDWLGSPMPNWSRPCPIQAQVAPNLGAGGATSFVFDRGEVFGWDMRIQGSEERILDSVLPHEVTHTIFASHFRQPLPRWADEGACTTVEHASERNKQQVMLVSFLRTGKGIAFHELFAMKDYPPDVLPLYSEGYSLARFLIDQGGRRKFVDFVGEGLKTENWSAAVNKHYGFSNLAVLQNQWLAWVKQGSPPLGSPAGEAIAAADRQVPSSANPIYRAQSGDRSGVKPAGYVRSKSLSVEETALVPVPPVSGQPAQDARWADTHAGAPDRDVAGAGWYASQRGAKQAHGDNDEILAGSASQPPWQTTPPRREPMLLAERDDDQASGPRRVLLEWRRQE